MERAPRDGLLNAPGLKPEMLPDVLPPLMLIVKIAFCVSHPMAAAL
jgi:hypothetical protein